MVSKKYNPSDYPDATRKKKRIEKILCTPQAKKIGITTDRQMKLAAEMVAGIESGKTFKQMAISAGYKVGDKSNVSHLKKAISGKLGHELLNQGITEFDIARGLMELTKATKCIVSRYKDKQGKPQIKLTEIPDNTIRHAAWLTVLKLGDYFNKPLYPLLPEDPRPEESESKGDSKAAKHFERRNELIAEFEVVN